AEAIDGGKRDVTVSRWVTCATCSGTGGAVHASMRECAECSGRGTMIHGHRFVAAYVPCPSCPGRKLAPTDPCPACDGEGRTERSQSLVVKVPPGVDAGQQLRIHGKGNVATAGGDVGDLYITLRIDYGVFTRGGDDLYLDAFALTEVAASGGTIRIPLVCGQA